MKKEIYGFYYQKYHSLSMQVLHYLFVWRQDRITGMDYSKKSAFNWISLIRLPDFIEEKDVEWAMKTTSMMKYLIMKFIFPMPKEFQMKNGKP